MPKRLIDFDALWTSGKLSRCKPSHRPEYLWIYGLADAGGSFELTNLRGILGKVSSIRPELTMRKLKSCLQDYQKNGLLFIWNEKEKKFGHWVGSRLSGRLPSNSTKSRYYLVCPYPPEKPLNDYESRYRSRYDSRPESVQDVDVDGIRKRNRMGLGLERGNPAQGIFLPPENQKKTEVPSSIGFQPDPGAQAEAERQKKELAEWQKRQARQTT